MAEKRKEERRDEKPQKSRPREVKGSASTRKDPLSDLGATGGGGDTGGISD